MPRERLRDLPPELRLPALAALCLLVAILAVVLIPHSAKPATASTRSQTSTVFTVAVGTHSRPHSGTGGGGLSGSTSTTPTTQQATTPPVVRLSLAKAVGQLIIATYPSTTPPASLLTAVKAGEVGGIILMTANTVGGVSSTRAAVNALQHAAHAGGNPGLLIMTDQEGGQVKRLKDGPPAFSAQGMGTPEIASEQGVATGKLLKSAGVNMDLAPVADVVRLATGFINEQQRSFGSNPSQVAKAACAFAKGLAGDGVAYTLKHFPGLGDAVNSTDGGSVAVPESASDIYADDAAYRQCGHGKLAAVMISSASYPSLPTGSTPAVVSRSLYTKVLPQDRINALLISDSFQSGAIEHLDHPARQALNAGLDMVMYPGTESYALSAYQTLKNDMQQHLLSTARVAAAANRVLAMKHSLGLG